MSTEFRKTSLVLHASKPDKEVVLRHIEIIINYLETLTSTYFLKTPKADFLYEWAYKLKVNPKDSRKYWFSNLFLAKESLKRIQVKVSEKGVSNLNKKILKNIICDLSEIIRKVDNNQDFDWLIMNTNTHITNFYFSLAKNSFWSGHPKPNSVEEVVLSSSSTFFIRQSIEYKIKRILGIDYINIGGTRDNRLTEKCFKVIEKNKSYYKFKNFQLRTVKNIYKWTHIYIHGGYRAEPWLVESALNYLEQFFFEGESSKKNSYSYYSSVEVKKETLELLKKNTVEELRKLSGDHLEIRWLISPEVAVV